MTFYIRLVGEPDHEDLEEREVIPFDSRENYENFQRVLDARGISYGTQEPLSEEDREIRADGGRERRCPECGEPVAVTAAHGPDRAILEPCGHTLPLTFVPDLQSAE